MKKYLLVSTLLLPFIIGYAQPATFYAHGLAGGGAQYAPSINPANPAEIYVACDMSGLYHSTDTGNSWSLTSFQQMQTGHPSMVQFTNNPNIRYCITFNNNSGNGYATKSTDGGNTWSFTTDATNGNGAWLTYANPQNSNQVIVSDYSDLYFSNDGGNTFGSAFYTDTTGAGAYIAGTFFDGLNIYICTNIGIMVSANGGASWSKPTMPGIPGATENIISCAGAKSGSTTRFFCITQAQSDVYVGETGDNNNGYMNVYSLDYGSGNWTKKETGILSNDLPFFVGMAGNNINVAYLAGNDNNTQYPEVLKTSNAGGSWTHVFNTANNENIQTGYCGSGGDLGWDWDQYAFGFTVSLTDTSYAVLTGEGFTHVTSNGGKTWQDAYVPRADLNPANASTPKQNTYHPNGIEVTSEWDLAWYDSLNVFSGCTDVTAIRSKDGGNTWANYSNMGYNTVYKFLKNPSNNVFYAATSSIHDMYESTRLKDNIIDAGTGEILYSTDGGSTYNTMNNFNAPVIWMSLDPTNSDRMYASVINHSGGRGGIWVSNNIQLNAAATWTHCNAPARTQGHPFNIRVLKDGTLVTSYCARINTSGKFTDSSGVFVSTDQGNTWLDRSDPGMKYWTMDVVIDPNDTAQNTWYCGVFDNWGGPDNTLGGLYRTINRGVNWTRIDTLEQVYSITFDPVHKGQAYVTTQQDGLYFSSNIEASTPTLTVLDQYPFRQPNRVYFNPYNSNEIWVNSFGNGLRMGNLLTSGIDNIKETASSTIYPNPNSGQFTLELNNSIVDKTTLVVYNIIGEKICTTPVVSENSLINLGVQPAGVYIYKVINVSAGIIGEGKIIVE
jgi:photosystem II stability/assembly factor-like uncharacterized protein